MRLCKELQNQSLLQLTLSYRALVKLSACKEAFWVFFAKVCIWQQGQRVKRHAGKSLKGNGVWFLGLFFPPVFKHIPNQSS